MTRRILLIVNGLGLGNSTRCHAVIQSLAAAGATVEVVTSGNGLWFFRDKPEVAAVHEVPALTYGKKNGRLSVMATVAGLASEAVSILRHTEAVLDQVVRRFRPQVAVTDSIYVFRTFKRHGVAHVALNNADMVMEAIGRLKGVPASVLPQFCAIELADYLYHRLYPDLVVSPWLNQPPVLRHGTYHRIAPIVRAGFDPLPPHKGPPRRVVIMLSGSSFGTPVVLRHPPEGVEIDVVGRAQPAEIPLNPRVRYHGRIIDTHALLTTADLVVINAGFSAVSEVRALHLPAVLIPVPRHAEQWANSRLMADLGVALTATEDNLEESLRQALGRIDDLRAACRALPHQPHGADQAAALILDLAGTGPTCL